MEDKVTLLEVLDRAAEKVGRRFAGSPELERSLRGTIAKTYHGLGSWEKAESQWRAKLDSARKHDPRSADTYLAQGELAHILGHRGRWDTEVLEMAEAAAKGLERTLGPDHPDTLEEIDSLAGAYAKAGRLTESIALEERVRDARIATLGLDHPATLLSMHNLAMCYQAAGKLDKALPLYEETLALQKSKLGPDHPDTLLSMKSLAAGYLAAGKLDKALPLSEETLALQKSKLGPDHPETLSSMAWLAAGYLAAGKLDKALPLSEETLALEKSKLGPDHPNTLISMSNLAACYWSMKRLGKSIPLLEAVLPLEEKKLGRDHPNTLLTVANLGVNYKDAGRLAEAIPLLEEAYQAAKKHPTLRWVGESLLDAYTKAGENAKLADLIQEQLADARRSLPKDSPELAGLLVQLGMIFLQQKKWTEAEPLLRECLTIREQKEPDDWRTFNTKSILGGALLGQKKYAEAEPPLLAGYEGMKLRESTVPEQGKVRLPEALDRLIELSTATNKPDEVKKWQAERAKYPEAARTPGEKK